MITKNDLVAAQAPAPGGKAIFSVEIERPHKIVESAFTDVRLVIEKTTGRKVLVGSITPQPRPWI